MTSGEVRERMHEFDAKCVGHGHSLKQKSGGFTSLQNLLPVKKFDTQMSNIYCYNLTMCKIVTLDVTVLKEILLKDPVKLAKLQSNIAHRLLSLNYENVPRL